MKTLKKLFSVSAIVALLGTLAPMYAFGATYSDELQDAYKYAYAHEVTTMTSIDNANMYGNLDRISLAKMIANYAINVLGMTPDTTKSCTFPDVTAAQDAQYDNGVTKACQLGLMGVGIEKFNPKGTVTRAEFGTAFSRALNADSDDLAEMNAATPYYKKHLEFLKSEGIMNQIDNPNQTEVRGYVMLMMMRSDDSYSPETVEGCTATELLACITADDYDACIAACSQEPEEEEQDPEEVKAGTLNVTMTSEKGGEIVNNVSALPIVTYTLKAVDEDIDINSLVLKEVGYGEGITDIALFINGQRVSKPKSVSALDKEITVNLNSAYTIKAGKSVDIEVRAAVDNTAVDAFAIELVNVNSSAEKLKLPSSAKSNTFKLLSTSTTEITVATTASEKVKVGSKNAEIFEFTIRNTSAGTVKKQDVELNTITFVASNKDMVDYFQNFELVVDGEVVATTSKMDGKYLTFKLNSAYTIEKSATANFTVKADVIGGADDTSALTFAVEYAFDVDATCPTYEAPVSVVPGAAVAVSIEAGRITITRTNPTSTTFAKNTNNVYLGSFTVTNNEKSDLTLEKFTLLLTDKDTNATVKLKDYILKDSVKVKYGKNAGYSSLDCDYNTAGTVLTCTSDTDVTIGSATTVYVYADIENNDTTDWLKDESFQMSLNVSNSDPVVSTDPLLIKENKTDSYVSDISAQTQWSLMEGTTSSLNVTRVSLSDKTFSYGTQGVDAVSFKIKTNDNGVKVKSLTFASAPVAAPIDLKITTADRDMIAATRVFVGDEEYSATLNSNGEITMKNVFELEANTTTTITLQIDLGNGGTSPVSHTFAYGLKSIVANDTTSDKNPLDYTPASLLLGRNITTNNGGTLTLSYENTAINDSDKSILAGTTAEIAEYGIKANYEKVNVKEMKVVFSKDLTSTNVDDVELYLNGELVASDPTWSTDGLTATFKDLTMSVDTTKAALVVKVVTKPYTANAVTALTDVYIDELNVTKANGKESGNDITKSCPDDSKVFDVVPATVVATLTSTSNTETKLNLAVNKGENVDASDDAVKVYIVDAVAQLVSDNGAMKSYTLTLNNKLIGTYTSSWALSTSDANDFELREGNNEVVINYTLNNVDNPSYNVDLLRVEYVTNTTHTIPATIDLTELATLKTTAFSNRMTRLDLVTR